MSEIVFLDKDNTLVSRRPQRELYEGAEQFCAAQAQFGRKLVITTDAGEKGRAGLWQIDHLLTAYIPNMGAVRWYENNGTLRNVADDYARRMDIPDVFHAEIAELDRAPDVERGSTLLDFLAEFVHKESQEPFDSSLLYKNPFGGKSGWVKDLHLMKRIVDPEGYAHTRAVMVGNESDACFTQTDPRVPLIVVYPDWASDHMRLERSYAPVACALDALLEDRVRGPHGTFDAIYDSTRSPLIGGWRFRLEKTEQGGRIIYSRD